MKTKKKNQKQKLKEAKQKLKEANTKLNAELWCPPIDFDDVLLAGYIVRRITANVESRGYAITDTNMFHFIAYNSIEELLEKDKKSVFGRLGRGWFKHGPYIPAIDSYLVLTGRCDKLQHQMHKLSKEVPSSVWLKKIKKKTK